MNPSHDGRDKPFIPPESPWYNNKHPDKKPIVKINLPPRPPENKIVVIIPFRVPNKN